MQCFTRMWFPLYSNSISYTQTPTWTNRLTNTYQYILAPLAMCKQQLPVSQWITCWHKNVFYRGPCLCETNVNKTKSFMWNTKNTDRNCINEQNPHTTYREKNNFRKGLSVLLSDIHLSWNNHPILPTSPLLWENSGNYLFFVQCFFIFRHARNNFWILQITWKEISSVASI